MPDTKFDFSGWATKNDILCTDGRTIRRDAFKECDGKKVPLVWMHKHDTPDNVIGHALLENRKEGVYAYCAFNNNEMAVAAKEAVVHGDVDSLSIYANQLKQQGGNVIHGVIREVSLVLAGANIGAHIDRPILAHGEEAHEDEAIIYNDEETLYLQHEDEPQDDEETEEVEEVSKESDKEESAEESAEPEETETDNLQHSEEDGNMADDNRTVADVFNSLSEEQKTVVYYMLGQALQSGGGDGGEEMKHNAFEMDEPEFVITHDDVDRIQSRAKALGSLKQAMEEAVQEGGALCHAVTDDDGNTVTYGIANLDYLFPDYKELNDEPDFIKRDDDWVSVFNNGVKKTPFARIKTTHANITMDEARAKGYMKGRKKAEEVFLLLRRQVDPQTVYKKQKFDRDDLIDLADFNVVAYVKREMQEMLKEEIARASLIGDGRGAEDPDKIFPEHIKPIYSDDPLYTIRIRTTRGEDESATAKNALKDIIRNRKLYKGSGNLIAFMSEDWLSEFLLLEDGFGHPLYKDEQELARKMRVSKIVTVPQLEGLALNGYDCMCIMVDLKDYTWGSNKMGETSFFDDFDIDYNQFKYLYETRLSGMLIKPYSAMVLEVPSASGNQTTDQEPGTGN